MIDSRNNNIIYRFELRFRIRQHSRGYLLLLLLLLWQRWWRQHGVVVVVRCCCCCCCCCCCYVGRRADADDSVFELLPRLAKMIRCWSGGKPSLVLDLRLHVVGDEWATFTVTVSSSERTPMTIVAPSSMPYRGRGAASFMRIRKL
jgi:hypothetical protein